MKTKQFIYFFCFISLFISACKKPKETEKIIPMVFTVQPVEITNVKAKLRANYKCGTEKISYYGFLYKKKSDDAWTQVSATQHTLKSFECNISTLENDKDFVYKAVIEEASGKKYYGEEMGFRTMSTLTDIDGNLYLTMRYGEMFNTTIWMTENLRVTRFADGTPIEGRNKGENTESDVPIYYYSHLHTNSQEKRDPNYGFLYNWAAATGAEDCQSSPKYSPPLYYVQGACPDGWHLPTGGDWGKLFDLYKWNAAYYKTDNWIDLPYTNNNYSQFSLEPAGFYNYDKMSNFNGVGHSAYLWTSAEVAEFVASCIVVIPKIPEIPKTIFMEPCNKWEGLSVRCVKDIVELNP